MKRQVINKPAVAAAITCPEACHADQPLDGSLLHRVNEHSRRLGEKPRRLEDDFGPGRNAERLDDDTDSADRVSARTEYPASRAAFTVSRPIPLLAPMIRTVATASCSTAELAWLTIMCNAGNRAARQGAALNASLGYRSHRNRTAATPARRD